MNRLWKVASAAAISLTVALTGIHGHGQTLQELELSSPGAFADGVEAYLYGYPLLMFGVTGRTATTVPDATTKLGAAPLNQFGKEMSLPDAKFSTVVLPSTSTLYASSFLDLSAEPIILHLPSITNRFFLMQMLDGWTEVSTQSPGSRLGSPEGDYALVGPNWDQPLPAGLQDTIRMPTNSMWIIGRIHTSGTKADINEVVRSIYPDLTLTPLSRWEKNGDERHVPPRELPLQPMVDVDTPPVRQVAGMDACAFFGNLASMMKFNPSIIPQDNNILPKLTGIGLVAGNSFDCTMLDAGTLARLQLAVIAARNFLNVAQTPPQTTTGWTVVTSGVGMYGSNYLLRAEVAERALGANNPIDAVYGVTSNDSTGAALDGSKNYKIHFVPPGSSEGIPPVNPSGFWSLTIYAEDGRLVPNDVVSYNAIGVPFVQGHKACFNNDGSLDLYLQSTPPSSAKAFCNWLPTPPGAGYQAF